jgi:5,10-methylenetetrahydrofolate reductase
VPTVATSTQPRLEACPKRMVYGPCGGVRPDLRCEMADGTCVFVGSEPRAWEGPTASAPLVPPGSLLDTAGRRSVVLTDLTVRPFDAGSVTEVVGLLAGSCDGVLIGEHQSRPDFPPTLLSALVVDAGGSPWATLTCRDRNRVVLEQEAEGLAVAGAAGVLCVTGDGRAHGTRPDVTQVFDIDSTRLTSLLAGTGLPVAVAEAPHAPPVDVRPHRLLAKQAAGASLCILNGAGSTERLSAFVRQAREIGVTIPFVAGIAVFTDERSARVLQAFPGLELDEVQVRGVLDAPDPVEAGIVEAVTLARAALAVDGVVGVNLSGLASDRGEAFGARVKADVGREILAAAA